ncbi:MAG: flagellar biosynthesis regulator FlaF [Mangrovicoccus sp.]|nr:flagellar biosynthesis regulator FlaF [Mangrovicoccus sp.]
MNAFDMARTAYSPANAAVRTPQSNEYEAFVRVTRRLKAADRPDAPFPEIVQALHENRRLWTFIATSVADGDNALPSDLRARLFYLGQFVEHHSRLVLRGEGALGVLVDINAAVMRGLRLQLGQP